MATVNNRVMKPQAVTINGISAGGLVTCRLQAGYDNILQNPVDGLQVSMVDRLTEFVRGNLVSQDWIHFLELLTGTMGTYVFYERKSGAAEATGYIKHTITNPVVHRCSLNLTHRGYGTVSADFECKAADETKGILDMWTPLDSQAAPSYVSAARSLEITACAHGALSVYHVTRLSFDIVLQLIKASQDGDVGYTAVDALLVGIVPSGTLTIQDSAITTAKLKAVELITASAGDLALTVKQSQGAANKTLTIANVVFGSGEQNADVNSEYDEFNIPFMVANDPDTPLTLSGDNKIVTIA